MGSRDVTAGKAAISHPRVWRRLWRDECGVVAVAVAVLLPVLIGWIGVEVGLWFAIQRQNESAADAAAIASGLEYAAKIERGAAPNQTAATAAAATVAACNLFSANSSSSNAVCPLTSSASNTLTLYPCYDFTVGSSCHTSSNGAAPNAVQVVLTQPLNTTFANFATAIWGLHVDAVTVATTSIAGFPARGAACLLALDQTADDALLVDNNGAVSKPNCWAAANSSSGSAQQQLHDSRPDDRRRWRGRVQQWPSQRVV